MTPEETQVINHIVQSGRAHELRKYIDQLTDSISDVWSPEDVISYCTDLIKPIECSYSDAVQVLAHMEHHHDAELGYNWDVLAHAVGHVLWLR